MASNVSIAQLRSSAADNLAYGLFGAFLVSIFFLNGGLSNVVVILTFVGAWSLVARDVRAGTLFMLSISPIALAFLTAVTFRLLLPPYGAQDVLPGAAVTRSLLIVGLYGLTLYAYVHLPFSRILWMLAGVSLVCTAAALLWYLDHGDFNKRMEFFGRASHPIFGAGAMAIGVLAVLTLVVFPGQRWSLTMKSALASAALALALAVIMTGSRGPLIALILGLAAGLLTVYSKSRFIPVICGFGAWVLVTSSVLFEASIHAALCPFMRLACRASMRQDVWLHAVEAISEHPFWGSGYATRFVGVPHAHNGYLGLALNFGIPILILFLALMVVALWEAALIKSKAEKFFVVSSLVFANGFMGSDLSDPMRFFNTHYLFLWFPLILALISEKTDIPFQNATARSSLSMSS